VNEKIIYSTYSNTLHLDIPSLGPKCITGIQRRNHATTLSQFSQELSSEQPVYGAHFWQATEIGIVYLLLLFVFNFYM
jgi:hypothetical protein